MLNLLKRMRTLSESEPRFEAVRSKEVSIDDVRHPKLFQSEEELKQAIYDLMRTIKDPEKPQTLEELNVVRNTFKF